MPAPQPRRRIAAVASGAAAGAVFLFVWVLVLLVVAALQRCPYPADCRPFRWIDQAAPLALAAAGALLFGYAAARLIAWRAERRGGGGGGGTPWLAAAVLLLLGLPTVWMAFQLLGIFFFDG